MHLMTSRFNGTGRSHQAMPVLQAALLFLTLLFHAISSHGTGQLYDTQEQKHRLNYDSDLNNGLLYPGSGIKGGSPYSRKRHQSNQLELRPEKDIRILYRGVERGERELYKGAEFKESGELNKDDEQEIIVYNLKEDDRSPHGDERQENILNSKDSLRHSPLNPLEAQQTNLLNEENQYRSPLYLSEVQDISLYAGVNEEGYAIPQDLGSVLYGNGYQDSSLLHPWRESKSSLYNTIEENDRYRLRRALTDPRIFVLRASASGNIFTVASTPPNPAEVFKFVNSAPPGLTLSSSGVVGLVPGYLWNLTQTPSSGLVFTVNVSSPTASPVQFPVKLLFRPDSEPLFTNEPLPLWTTVPVWIRPGTPVLTLQARATAQNGANVTYRLEAGGDGKFAVDPWTGDVTVVGRQMFDLGRVYTLSVSAQCVGVLPTASTPAQLVSVQVGTRAPQFYPSTLNISFSENLTANAVVSMLQAKSFQGFALQYSMTPISPTPLSVTGAAFSLDAPSGTITLLVARDYAHFPHQYVFSVSVSEQYTQLSSSATLILNLAPANHAPRFLVQYYVNNGLSVAAPVGTPVINVLAYDYDPGVMGQLTYAVSDPHFTVVQTAPGMQTVQVAMSPLDYEFLNEHRYELTLWAVDGGSPPLSGSTNLQVYMMNANVRAPVLEPTVQVVWIKEGGQAGLRVHYVQAYDPDGDGISFQPDPSATDSLTASYFGIDSSGVVTLVQAIPRSRGPNVVNNFTLGIMVTDDGTCCAGPSTRHTTRGTVVFKLQRINTQPVFASCYTYQPSVLEMAAVGTSVLTTGAFNADLLGFIICRPGNKELACSPDLPRRIVKMIATDPDMDADGSVDFSIVNTDAGPPPFNVSMVSDGTGRTALLTTTIQFNLDQPLPGLTFYKFNDTIKYPVTVKVQDRGKTPLATNCFMLVTITDVNLNAPVFDYTSADYQTSVLVTSSSGDRVMRVYATDADSGENGRVTYTLDPSSAPNCLSNFIIDLNLGWITRTTGALPGVTSIACVVVASDHGTPPKTTFTSVTFNVVTSAASLLPRWLPINMTTSGSQIDDYQYSLSEDVPVYTWLALSLAATTPLGSTTDVGYYLTSNNSPQLNANNDFELPTTQSTSVAQTAGIRTAHLLDASLLPAYVLRLRAFSPASAVSGQASVARLRVLLLDVNNKAPKFLGMDANGIYPAAVSEYTQAAEAVIYVTAIDLDRDYVNNRVTYNFRAACSDCTSFSIDQNSGLIRTAVGNFTRATQAVYVLYVQASDGVPSAIPGVVGPNIATRTVSVMVNGASSKPPYFLLPFYAQSISSGLPPNSTCFVQTAFDPDTDTTYNHIIQYEFQSGNEQRKFAVDITSGRVYNVREILYNASQPTYSLTYRVFDGATINTTLITVAVSGGVGGVSALSPVFNPTFYASPARVTEKDPGSVGTGLVTVHATTADGSPVLYSVLDATHFSINPQSGVMTLAQPLDRDYPDGYAVWQTNVVAMATSGQQSLKRGYGVVSVTPLDINDHAPTFDTCCLWGTISELASPGTTVLQLVALDPDAGANGTVTYSLTPGQGAAGPWQVSPAGAVTLTSGAMLNFDTQTYYPLVVTASDLGSPPRSATQTVQLYILDGNNHPPSFVTPKSYLVSIPEEMPIGASVLTATATDPDPTDRLTYSLVPAQTSFYTDSVYAGNMGVIKIAQRIDYDAAGAQTVFTFSVRVADPDPSRGDTASVSVSVYDINDNAPVFLTPYVALSLLETKPVNSALTTVQAMDRDSGINADFSYYVDYEHTDQSFRFKVDLSTGVVQLRNVLDRETQSLYNISILAIDRGVPPLTGTATLAVTVIGVNDSPPLLSPPLPAYPAVVRSGAVRGDTVYCFQATDPDQAVPAPIQFDYSACTDPHCSDFTLQASSNSSQACLIANRDGYSRSTLDYTSYNITVRLIDPTATPPLASLAVLPPIIIESLNDRAPAAATKTVMVYNYASPTVGLYTTLPLGNVYVVDDDWDLSAKTFTPQTPFPPEFSLVPGGQLVLQGTVPPGVYILQVLVTDSKFPSMPAVGTVVVSVALLNDSVVQSAGSIRLSGLNDAADLLLPIQLAEAAPALRLDVLKDLIAGLVGTRREFVDVFSVSNVPGSSPLMVDVVYAAHGSPYYSAEKLNALVCANKDNISAAIQAGVEMSPVDLCRVKFQNCWSDGCATQLSIGPAPRLLNTNQTSLVGLDSTYIQFCGCPSRAMAPPTGRCDGDSCLNGGSCPQNPGSAVTCLCPAGYDGPLCQRTKLSLPGGGASWAQYAPLESCASDRLSVEFITAAPSGLMLYNGPMSDTDATALPDFISLELLNGVPKLRINLGDGEITLPPTPNTFPRLDDNAWHTLEVFHIGLSIRLVVDHCTAAPVTETIANSTQDRTSCEASAVAPGENFLLSVSSPLQLGGRANAANQNVPLGLTKTGFNGCIKNVQHNAKLYDLSLGPVRQFVGATEGCSRELCAPCSAPGSLCVGGLSGTAVSVVPTCSCPPGIEGISCATSPAVTMFQKVPSYASWTLNQPYATTAINSSVVQMSSIVELMFRTVQTDGVIFFAESFSTLERIILEVVGGRLQFRFDLGSGDRNVTLTEVRVNDGAWHVARVDRYGAQVTLRLDGGDGPYFGEVYPSILAPLGEHQLLRVSPQISGGGVVRQNQYSQLWGISNSIQDTCLTDVRYANNWLPLSAAESAASPLATLRMVNTQDACLSSACVGVTCGLNQICDPWSLPVCRCINPLQTLGAGGACVALTSCAPNPCVQGWCYLQGGSVACVCAPGWGGAACSVESGASSGANTSLILKIVLPIIFGILLLVLLALLLLFCLRRRGKDKQLLEPDQDTRETIGSYDEEGAGEEDIYVYDLSRLQKPVDPDLDSMDKPMQDVENVRHWGPLTSASPEELAGRRLRPLGGEYPEVDDFIADRLKDADADPPSNDALRPFEWEGGGSQRATLSSIATSSSDQGEYGYLNNLGAPFSKLADIYGRGEGEEDEEGGVGVVGGVTDV